MPSPSPESSFPTSEPVAARRPRRWLGALIALVGMAVLVGGSWYLIHRPPAPVAGAFPGGPGGGMGRGGGGRGSPGAGGAGGPLVTVGQAVVHKASVPVMLDALGTVTPLAMVSVKPQVAGVMTEVLFTEGQMVKKDQVIARIDPRPYEQALMQAKGTRVRDEAQLEAARVTLTRYRTLQGQDSIAVQDVDTQAALVKQLEGTVVTDRAAEAAAQLNLDYTRVTSPVAGRVGLRAVDPGNYVATGGATAIATVTQITPIDVLFSIPQDRVPEIQRRVAQGAKLEVAVYDRTRVRKLDTGTFSTLDNQVDVTTGTVKAKARFTNAAGELFPSQFVNVRLVLRMIDDALVVPVTALRTSGSGNYVYVINADHTVSMRPVQRGEASVENVVITDGLKEGEQVVTEGGDRLKDGSRVQLPSEVGTRGAGGAGGGRAAGEHGGWSGRRHPGGAGAPGGPAPAGAPSGGVQGGAPGGASDANDGKGGGEGGGMHRHRHSEGDAAGAGAPPAAPSSATPATASPSTPKP